MVFANALGVVAGSGPSVFVGVGGRGRTIEFRFCRISWLQSSVSMSTAMVDAVVVVS